MSYFEIAMLVCFGAAWPFSIYRSYVSKSTKGKSAVFLIIVIIGYASGILHKMMYSFDGVIWCYIVNMVMVIIDTSLYYRNRFLEKQ
jgi:hypothetical protein